jgi:hypothetical protein
MYITGIIDRLVGWLVIICYCWVLCDNIYECAIVLTVAMAW